MKKRTDIGHRIVVKERWDETNMRLTRRIYKVFTSSCMIWQYSSPPFQKDRKAALKELRRDQPRLQWPLWFGCDFAAELNEVLNGGDK